MSIGASAELWAPGLRDCPAGASGVEPPEHAIGTSLGRISKRVAELSESRTGLAASECGSEFALRAESCRTAAK